jgi:intein/homing endonuclease
LADGSTKDIEEVAVGDEVATYDERTGVRTVGKVANAFIREADGVFVVRFAEGDEVVATGEHPFYVSGRGWVEAKDLVAGLSVSSSSIVPSTVASVAYRSEKTTVYNFEGFIVSATDELSRTGYKTYDDACRLTATENARQDEGRGCSLGVSA